MDLIALWANKNGNDEQHRVPGSGRVRREPDGAADDADGSAHRPRLHQRLRQRDVLRIHLHHPLRIARRLQPTHLSRHQETTL